MGGNGEHDELCDCEVTGVVIHWDGTLRVELIPVWPNMLTTPTTSYFIYFVKNGKLLEDDKIYYFKYTHGDYLLSSGVHRFVSLSFPVWRFTFNVRKKRKIVKQKANYKHFKPQPKWLMHANAKRIFLDAHRHRLKKSRSSHGGAQMFWSAVKWRGRDVTPHCVGKRSSRKSDVIAAFNKFCLPLLVPVVTNKLKAGRRISFWAHIFHPLIHQSEAWKEILERRFNFAVTRRGRTGRD